MQFESIFIYFRYAKTILSKVEKLILRNDRIHILQCNFWKFGFQSRQCHRRADECLYSHHMPSWRYTNVVRDIYQLLIARQVQTYILLTGCHKVLLMSVLRMWFYINYHISLSSLVSCSWHLFTRYCLGIVMRDKILTYKFKFSSRAFLFIFFPCLGAASLRHAYNFIQANKVLNIVTRFRLLSSQSCQQSGVFSGRV